MIPGFLFNRRQLIAGSALLLAPLMAGAQGTPVPSAPTGFSAAVRLDRLPGKRVNVFFARHSFMPQAGAPMFDRVGSALVLVESGTLNIASDGPVISHRSGEPAPEPPAEAPADGILLGTGDALLIPHGQRMSIANASDEAATLLMLIVYAPYHEFSYVNPTTIQDAPDVETRIIGFGFGAFEEVPALMLIDRDLVRPGGSAYSTTFGGIEIGGIASGSARATFGSGTNWTTQGAMGRSGTPKLPGDVHVEVDAIVDLKTSDGYVSRDGSINWRATGDGPLVVLRAQVIPVPQPA